jgi:hypothetical protein
MQCAPDHIASRRHAALHGIPLISAKRGRLKKAKFFASFAISTPDKPPDLPPQICF